MPFSFWEIDLIGALLTILGGLKYCVIVVDYFTNWIEVESLTTITSENIKKIV